MLAYFHFILLFSTQVVSKTVHFNTTAKLFAVEVAALSSWHILFRGEELLIYTIQIR